MRHPSPVEDSYGGIPDSQGVFHGCVSARTGALRVVKRVGDCHRAHTVRIGHRQVRIPGELAIAWNQQGRQGDAGLPGPQGLPGPEGATGPQGPTGTPDTTQFYTKAQSDERFVRGSGTLTRIAPVTTADGSINPGLLIDLPGAGKLEVTCAQINTAVRYTNESTATQRYVLATGLTANKNTNGAPDNGTVAAAATLQNIDLNNNDVLRLSVIDGTQTLDFAITFTRDGSSNCVDWGSVYTG